MHKLLMRQLRKLLPPDVPQEAVQDLLSAVNAAYEQSDLDRQLLERSLEISSRELTEQNREIQLRLDQITLTQQQLASSLSLLDSTLNATADAVLVVDLEGNAVIANSAFLSLFDLAAVKQESPLDAASLRRHIRSQIRNLDELYTLIRHTTKQVTANGACELQLHDGRYIDCRTQPRVMEGQTVGRVWSLSDITPLKRREQEALFNTYHDTLTGLPNRILFTQHLAQALEHCAEDEEELAVLMIDLDAFKHVNDTLGVEGGDQLLKQVAERLETNLPRDALLARQNADEFLILLRAIKNSFEPTLVAEKILTALQERFVVEGDLIHLSGSIGVTLAPSDGMEAEALIRKADMAMTQAKQSGKNSARFFAQEYEAIANQRLHIRNSLRTALNNHEFFVEYQPKISLTGERKMVGCEALLRWERADGTRISPAQFIPIAEEYGFINEIGEGVIANVCDQLSKWRDKGCQLVPVAINISVHQLRQENFVDILRFNLMTRNLPSHLLEIEITESALMQDLEPTITLLNTLQELGIHVSLDDFGTGYSSFSYLKHLPVDTLKIDKSFIDDMHKSARDNALVRTLIQLAHTLGMAVVAEGVESHASLNALEELGCDQVQGFIFSKPVSAETLCEIACKKQF